MENPLSPAQESSSPNGGVSRRGFVKSGAAAIAGGAIAGRLATAQGVHAAGGDMLRVGLIGCGGRGKGAAEDVMQACEQLNAEGGAGRVEIVALADAFRGQIDRCHRRLAAKFGNRVNVPSEQRFAGLDAYRQLLKTDCDLVVLATPPGFRPYHFEAAIEAGKHVFMEKPVAVDPAGIRRVLAAGELAAEKGLAVGVGLQRRHNPKYVEAIDRIRNGDIGRVMLTRAYWNSGGVWTRTPSDFAGAFGHRPNELEQQVYNWYYFNWLCGDHIVEQHIHNLDVSNWAVGATPVSANGIGGREVRNGKQHGQIFDHHAVEFTYADGTTMLSQCRHQPGCWRAVYETIQGTEGTAELGSNKACAIKTAGGETAYQGPAVRDYVQEHVDLQRAIRGGRAYNETQVGADATMTAILGRLATYSGKIVTWDEALASEIVLAPEEPLSWDATPPVLPDADGRYPVPVPGESRVV